MSNDIDERMWVALEKFIDYGLNHYDKMFMYVIEHLEMCGISILISLLISIIISMVLLNKQNLSKFVLALLGAGYSIPSLALFAILMPIFGLGKTGAIFALVLYSQYILTRNILEAFRSIDDRIIEAAVGMGMSWKQQFFEVQLPLALPVIIGGIRIALLSTIASAIIAQTINAGGIGVLLFEGLRTMNTVKMVWGTILASSVALSFNYIFERLEVYTLKRARGEISD